MTQHTPTPWTINAARADESSATLTYFIDGADVTTDENDLVAEVRIGANAAHIVHCVNTYEQLVAALEAVTKAKHDAENDECYSLNAGIHEEAIYSAFEFANSTLVAAKEGSAA